MAFYQVEVSRSSLPGGSQTFLMDVVVANSATDPFYVCITGNSPEGTLFQYVNLLNTGEYRNSIVHIRNIGIYDTPITLTITTSIHDLQHATIRLIFKNEHNYVLGLWNEESMQCRAVQ